MELSNSLRLWGQKLLTPVPDVKKAEYQMLKIQDAVKSDQALHTDQ